MNHCNICVIVLLVSASIVQCSRLRRQQVQAEAGSNSLDLQAVDLTGKATKDKASAYEYDYGDGGSSDEATEAKPTEIIPTTVAPKLLVIEKLRRGSSSSKKALKMRGFGDDKVSEQRRMEEAKLYRKATIKRLLLEKLEMLTFPNLTGVSKYMVPAHILHPQVKGKSGGMHDEPAFVDSATNPEGHAELDRAFVFADSLELSPLAQHASGDTLRFNVPDNIREAKKATLSIYVRGINSSIVNTKFKGKRRATLRLYSDSPDTSDNPTTSLPSIEDGVEHALLKLVKPKKHNLKGKQTSIPAVAEKIRVRSHGEWIQFEVTKEVASWLAKGGSPGQKFGLIVRLNLYGEKAGERGAGQSLLLLNPQTEEEKAYAPFLEVGLEKRSARKKRDIGMTCSQKSPERRCCKYEYTVNFEDFGPEYDFILSPRRYHAGYCSGSCPPYFLTFQPNTQLTMSPSRSPKKKREPCCTPSKMKPLRMMYYNDEKVLMSGTVPGMVIESCGCA